MGNLKASDYVAIVAILLVGIHGLVAGFVHTFTEINWMDNDPPEFLWALAALGNKQTFIATIDFAVGFDISGSRHLLSPLLALHIAMTAFYAVSTAINGRYIHLIAPTSPGNYAPYILSAICAIGIFAQSRGTVRDHTTKKAK